MVLRAFCRLENLSMDAVQSVRDHIPCLSKIEFNYKALLIIGFLVLVGGTQEFAYAEAFRILPQGASAIGQGNAFTAQADDPSAIHYNPAGMTQLQGMQVLLGTTLVGGSVSYISPSGSSIQGDVGGTIAVPPPSNMYLTANLKDMGLEAFGDPVVGVGVTSPFGLNIRYPNEAPFSSTVTTAQLPLLDIKPTIAIKLTDQLSVGLGADLYTFASFIGEGHFEQKFNNPGIPGIPVGTPLEINGKDTAAGFNVSLLYTPIRNAQGKPLVNIGVVYRSQATLHLEGDFLVNGAQVAKTDFTLVLPQVYSGGIAIWPVRNAHREWKLELDLDYIGWKSLDNLDVRLSNGATLPFPQNWRNSYMVMVGTEHRWLQVEHLPDWEIALRGGYIRSQTPIPEATFNPTVPESDFNAISVGLGLLCKKKAAFLGLFSCGSMGSGGRGAMGLDIAYQVQLYEWRTISNNVNPIVDGKYRTILHVGAINFRVIF